MYHETTGALPATESKLDELLRQIADELRPVPSRIAEAEQRAAELIRAFDRNEAWMFEVLDVREHGSLSRGTAIRDFTDLDKLIVLDETALLTLSGKRRSTADTIARMKRHVSEKKAGLISLGQIRLTSQNHSLGVNYPKSNIKIDLVPCVQRDGWFEIPEKETRRWIRTDPEETKRRLQRAVQQAPDVIPAIRLLKGWKRARGHFIEFPSFALETLLVTEALQRPRNLLGFVTDFFSTMAARNARHRLVLGPAPQDTRSPVTLIDPVSGNNLTEKLTRRHSQSLIRFSRKARDKLLEVDEALQHDRERYAERLLKALFLGSWG